MEAKTVYQAISAVSEELAKTGVGKSDVNSQIGFSFRGIDTVMNAVAPLLPKHGLVILPEVLSREVVQIPTRDNKTAFNVTLEVVYHFVSTEDGSKHAVKVFGEAMDWGDKATNKAMSIAYKYALFQAFAIPTEATDPDAAAYEAAGYTAEQHQAFLNLLDSSALGFYLFRLRVGDEVYSNLCGSFETDKTAQKALAADQERLGREIYTDLVEAIKSEDELAVLQTLEDETQLVVSLLKVQLNTNQRRWLDELIKREGK